MTLLEVNDLSVSFVQNEGWFRRRRMPVLQQLRLTVNTGEVVAVLGASGAGKSLLAHAILGILPRHAEVSGSLLYAGERLTPQRQAELRGREIALVPQSVTYLDPLMPVGRQVRHAVKRGDKREAQRESFRRYRLGEKVGRQYPFQLSGGMARRVLVAAATASGARLLIADEPTPGLDPAVMREALGRFRELADEGCGVLLISHDIASALTIADHVAVMYAGTIVEIARAADFTDEPAGLRHPYTQALWRALPQNGFAPLAGAPPQPGELAHACAFAPRCPAATEACLHELPPARELRHGLVRCIHAS
ncbi:ABC transporter ATP-binding protein [Xylanibacillus composti]|uniref:Nickel import system ATP-binding protein NikD n=1 Tax=Xylanibacillus composti TaxID=1572762 RepID=A0A8J4M178_9BACL|nr:ABC transporter ATP-binding protein [Xylanibacillus composti]MDT9723925.1 ABC transporter ATP-binding protein [Xylanibacillus composti]GIQ67805.1 ABC transporter ATP-binding protein [Xylanibacillus composti]